MIRILFFAIFSPVVLLSGWKLTKFLRPIISRTSWIKRMAYAAAIAASGVGLHFVYRFGLDNASCQFAGDLISAVNDCIGALVCVDVLVVGYLCIMFCAVPYRKQLKGDEQV